MNEADKKAHREFLAWRDEQEKHWQADVTRRVERRLKAIEKRLDKIEGSKKHWMKNV